MLKFITILVVTNLLVLNTYAQVRTNKQVLEKTAKDYKEKKEKEFEKVLASAKTKGWIVNEKTKEGRLIKLVGIDQFGLPQYLTSDNTIAAATTGANRLWTGGTSGLNLSGASDNVKGKMAVWDEARVLSNHVELNGRIIQKDNPSNLSDHATHVTGTIAATGINPLAKGMAYGIKQLLAYDFDFLHFNEIATEASNLLVSNHSYGILSGWYYNSGQTRWEFRGRADENEDYKFGYYDTDAQFLDSVAYNAPFYLIVKSAGNNRSQIGPAVGQTYWRYNSSGQMVNSGPRPEGIYSNNAYDILPTYSTAKNILTVGAVSGINNGYYKVSDVAMSSFSSWGPTDDGRIKPDIVANGVSVYSTWSNGSYSSISGTSMSSPNASGSLFLLQDYYSQLNNGAFMRAATLKGLAIHTADEAGDAPGPDYKFGWGLLNVAKAAEVIKVKNSGNHRILENVLVNGQMFSTTVIASGKGPLTATISWTDPKGNVEFTDILNNRALKLIHDLDIKITAADTTFRPWRLDPGIPQNAATKGDNLRDNVERVDIENPLPGRSYVITITHKDTLLRGSQAYSLIMSGVGGQPYCNNTATTNTTIRIDSVAFAGIKKLNTNSCISYNDFTALVATAQPNQKVPLSINLSSCNNTTVSKWVKVFIDYNNNGSFSDAEELVAISTAIEGIGVFTATVQIPSSVVPGNTTVLRIVAQSAVNADAVNACGASSTGEIQDYLIKFVPAASDVALLNFGNTESISCENPTQRIALTLRNNGSGTKTNFPIAVDVMNGSNKVASVNTILKQTLAAGEVFNFTLPLSFSTVAGNTYTIKAIVTDSTDQVVLNDTLLTTLTIAPVPAAPSGTGTICAGTANLIVPNPVVGNEYFWSTGASTPTTIGRGSFFSTTNVPANNTYFVGSGIRSAIGLTSKSNYPTGGGYLANTGNFIRYSSSVPLILESARIYSKFGGRVDISVIETFNETTSGSYSFKTFSTVSIDVPTTSPTPASGSVTGYDDADTGAVVKINLPLPQGIYAIRIVTSGGTNLFRSNNMTDKPYPFSVPGVISFFGNSASLSSTDPDFHQSFYYFLYDAKIKTADCISSRSIVVATIAPVPAISIASDSLVSSSDTGNQWNLNGTPINGATGKKYKPIQSGEYAVTVIDSTNCVQTSAALNFTITAVNPVLNAEVSFKIAPVPSNGKFTVSMNLPRRDDLRMDFINTAGQTVYSKSFAKVQGRFNETVNLTNQAAGMYSVRIVHSNTTYFNKILIQR